MIKIPKDKANTFNNMKIKIDGYRILLINIEKNIIDFIEKLNQLKK